MFSRFRLEVAVEPWMDGLFPAIKRFLNSCKTHCDTAGALVHSVDDTSNGGVTNGTAAMETIKNCSDDKIVNLSLASESKTAVVSTSTPTSVTSESQTAVVPSSTPTSVTSESKTAVVSTSTPTSVTSESQTAVVPSSTPTSVTSESRTAVVSISEGDLLGRKRETSEANQLLSTSDGNLQRPSLQHSVPPLSESSLTLPFLPPKFLSVVFRPEESFVCMFVHSFIHSYIHTFIHTFIHSFIHSFFLLLNHTFIHSFVNPSIHFCFLISFADWL